MLIYIKYSVRIILVNTEDRHRQRWCLIEFRQHAIPSEYGGKWELDSQVPSAHIASCGIQRETKIDTSEHGAFC